MAQPTESIRPYADLIESTYGNTQTRLVRFLRLGYGYRFWENRDPHTNIYILDSINSSLTSQHFRPHHLDEVSSQFQTALVSRPPSSETRILLVQTAQLGDMSTAYLDAIGWHFQLDPSFFCAFIEIGLHLTEGDDITGPRQLPISLPSENDFITIATDTNSSFAIFSIKREDTLNTVIMLSFDHHSENQIKDFHTHLISQPRDVIKATNTNPCDFLLFYIRRSLNKSASLARRHAYIKPSLESERPLSGYLWERNQANLRNLLSSRKSLLRYLRRNFPDVQKSQPCLASVIPDYDFVIDDTRENATQLQSLLQTYTSLQAIKESKRGLEQADAVRRITLVGMVFIPLSFATSFFGMNFEQLGAGTLHIGFFVLLAALSGLVAWLLAVSIGPAETMWTRARNRYGEREFGFVDNYDWVTKRMVFWGWMCRKSSVANSLYKLWVDERDQIMVDADEDNEANIPRLRRKVALRLILLLLRRGKKKLKDLNNFMLRKHSTGNSPIDIADSEAPSQQVTSS